MKPHEGAMRRETIQYGDEAHHIPAVDYVRQDWDNGTLRRVHDPKLDSLVWFAHCAAIALAALGTIGGAALALWLLS